MRTYILLPAYSEEKVIKEVIKDNKADVAIGSRMLSNKDVPKSRVTPLQNINHIYLL